MVGKDDALCLDRRSMGFGISDCVYNAKVKVLAALPNKGDLFKGGISAPVGYLS